MKKPSFLERMEEEEEEAALELYETSPHLGGWSDDEDEDGDDGVVYYEDEEELDDDQFDKYNAQVAASEGFEVDYYPVAPGMIIPGVAGGEAVLFSKIALHHYNLSKGTDFDFVEISHRNVQVVQGDLSYITFMAQSGESIKTFQARVWRDVLGPNGELPLEVHLCRIKPTSPSESESASASASEGEESGSNSPPEKRQKTELEGEEVDTEEEIDASFLNLDNYFLGGGIDTNFQDYEEYCTQVQDSKGFDVNNFPPLFAAEIMPLESSERSCNLVRVFAELAISHYRMLQCKKSGPVRFEFLGVEKAIVQSTSVTLVNVPFKAKNANFFITFKVKNKDDGSTQTLQTLIWSRVLEEGQLQIQVKFVFQLLPASEGN